jgi:hypothetical protein
MRDYIIEVKPTYPYLDEQIRCCNVAYQTSVPVVLLYGEVAPPWQPAPASNHRYHRASPGMLGIMWRQGASSAVERREVVWKMVDGRPCLAEVDDIANDMAWRHPTLLRAYDDARARVP